MPVSSPLPSRSGRVRRQLLVRSAPIKARALANLADLFLVAAFTAVVSSTWTFIAGMFSIAATFIAALVGVAIREVMLVRSGTTPGMTLMRIRMIDRFTGGRPGSRAFVHTALTTAIVILTAGIGAILLVRSMLCDPHRTGWNDHVSDVRIISTNSSNSPRDQRFRSSSRATAPSATQMLDTSTSAQGGGQVIIDSVPWSSAPVPVDPPAGYTSRSSVVLPPSSLVGARTAVDAIDRESSPITEDEASLQPPSASSAEAAVADSPGAVGGVGSDSPTGPTAEANVTDIEVRDAERMSHESPREKTFIPVPSEPTASAERPPEAEDPLPTEALDAPAALLSARADANGKIPSIRLVPLDGGAPLMISTVTVVGRQPENISEVTQAELCAIDDTARSVSKTHALLVPADKSLWVMDLHSTNGTYITVDGATKRVDSMLPAPDGATIVMGRTSFRVECV